MRMLNAGPALRLREIMTTDVVTVTPETTVREAMELLAQRHVSGAPVVQAGTLVGVVTSTDLMAFAAALSGVPTSREFGDELGEGIEQPSDEEIDPGTDCPAAYFHEMWEDAGADVTERIAVAASPEWNALDEHDVSEMMTRTPLATLPVDATAEQAATMMRSERIHRVLVTDGDMLAGIVSAFDIATAVADHRLTTRTYVFDRSRGSP
jgi:CBS domain-containing protein